VEAAATISSCLELDEVETNQATDETPDSVHIACDYRVLMERVRGAGLLRRRQGYYVMKIALTLAAFGLGWAALFVVGNSWATLGVAAFLAVLSVQVVFFGHDAGHQQIARTPRMNRLIGLIIGNLLTGLSFGWWVPKHNAHHAYPNQLGRDPDMGAGLIAFTVVGVTHESQGAIPRLRRRLEVWLFVFVLLLQGLGLHVTGVQSIIRRRDRMALTEGLLLVANTAVYLTLVFLVLSVTKALAFIAVQQGLFGLYLGFSFAPNHKGMPVIGEDADVPFVERQVMTARNVIGGRLTTVTLGGLNYQIEHHLFPTMPRPHLSRAQPYVRAFCAENGLPYREERPVDSYRQALRHAQSVITSPTPLQATSTT
jgi:fatty acid desaturase